MGLFLSIDYMGPSKALHLHTQSNDGRAARVRTISSVNLNKTTMNFWLILWVDGSTSLWPVSFMSAA